MNNARIPLNLQGLPMLKSPNLNIDGNYECVLVKYPESNAYSITFRTILLLEEKKDAFSTENIFNWILNCSGYALRIDDFSKNFSTPQISIFKTAFEFYLKWLLTITKIPRQDSEKYEKYIRLLLIHLSQIFLNPSFTYVFSHFIKTMETIFIHSHPTFSEKTWATLIKVLLCGSWDYVNSTNDQNFTQISNLAFDILIESTFSDSEFLQQFDFYLHKLFSFPAFSYKVWLKLFVTVYNPIIKRQFITLTIRKIKLSQESNERRRSSFNESQNAFLTKLNIIFEYVRSKINQEFTKEAKNETFSRAIHCWFVMSKNVKFPVYPKWPTDTIKQLFLDWYSPDCEWIKPPFHAIFTLIQRGEKETTPELHEIATNLIIKTLDYKLNPEENDLFWYLPVYAYDFLMDNLDLLDSLELPLLNFCAVFQSSKMTNNLDIYQHLIFLLIRLVQRTNKEDIRNTLTNFTLASISVNQFHLTIISILTMVVVDRPDMFWTQINRVFSNKNSARMLNNTMFYESFSGLLLIASFVPLILKNNFAVNVNLDHYFWDLLEPILGNSTTTPYSSPIASGKNCSTQCESSIIIEETTEISTVKSNLDAYINENNTGYLNQLFGSNKTVHQPPTAIEKPDTIYQLKVLLGLFCLSQGTDLFTMHPEYTSKLLSLLETKKKGTPPTHSFISKSNSTPGLMLSLNELDENKQFIELNTFRKMTILSLLCGGRNGIFDYNAIDITGYTENFITKKFIVSIMGQNHLLIRHALGVNAFRIEDLGGRDCYKRSLSNEEVEQLLQKGNDANYKDKKATEDLYRSPFGDDPELTEAFQTVDSLFNDNESFEIFKKMPEKSDVSDAHSVLCDLGFISADSSLNTKLISNGSFRFLKKLDKTAASPIVDVYIFQLLDDNDTINEESSNHSTKERKNSFSSRYRSLAYALTNRGKKTKNMDELLSYLNKTKDCQIATINYHLPDFDDESELEINETDNNDIEDQMIEEIERSLELNDQNPIDETIRKTKFHFISQSQANQIGFLILLNETGMDIDPSSYELNRFEFVVAVTPHHSKSGTDNNDTYNYIVDIIPSHISFFGDGFGFPRLRFYLARNHIGWFISLCALMFFATPGKEMEGGYTQMRGPTHFTTGFSQREMKIKQLFEHSESGRNTILVGCLSCGIKQTS